AAAEAARPELAGPGRLALFNQGLPGPVLRVKKGGTLNVALANGLKEDVALTWHGLRGPSASAAVASAPVAGGKSGTVSITAPDAGTFWYHAANPALARRALAGALVVEEPGPALYGADHVLFIQSFPPETGMPIFPVNGAISPTFQGPADGRARLRFINATTLFLKLRVRGPAAYVIAVDGQPAEPFELKEGRLQLPPGGRADVAATLDDADVSIVELETTQDPIRLAVIAPVGPAGTAPDGPPPALPPNALPKEIPLQNAARFDVPIGETAAGPPVVGSVKAGRVVVLTLSNTMEAPVSVHIQGTPVRLLDGMDDGWKPWWHDTVPVAPKSTVRVAFLADSPGRWPIIAQRVGDGAVVASRAYEVTPG
ncbi:multicopper oxidase family protein, partial [Xanthobacter pseudotagetidis]|uniref:multicopper oxidase family protein n=1 Tax=Xanthobacter pseudotagetidis TaxID=3119911 RepID=UPI003729BAB4